MVVMVAPLGVIATPVMVATNGGNASYPVLVMEATTLVAYSPVMVATNSSNGLYLWW